MKNNPPSGPSDSGRMQEKPVFVRVDTAARLIDMTAMGLRKRLSRSLLPPGIVTRCGRTLLVHREHFLTWISEGSAKAS